MVSLISANTMEQFFINLNRILKNFTLLRYQKIHFFEFLPRKIRHVIY